MVRNLFFDGNHRMNPDESFVGFVGTRSINLLVSAIEDSGKLSRCFGGGRLTRD